MISIYTLCTNASAWKDNKVNRKKHANCRARYLLHYIDYVHNLCKYIMYSMKVKYNSYKREQMKRSISTRLIH